MIITSGQMSDLLEDYPITDDRAISRSSHNQLATDDSTLEWTIDDAPTRVNYRRFKKKELCRLCRRRVWAI